MKSHCKICPKALIAFICGASVSGVFGFDRALAEDELSLHERDELSTERQDRDSEMFNALETEYSSSWKAFSTLEDAPGRALGETLSSPSDPFLRISLNLWAMSPRLFESKSNLPQGARVTDHYRSKRRFVPSGLAQFELNLHSYFSVRGVLQYYRDKSRLFDCEGIFAGVGFSSDVDRRIELNRTTVEGHLVVHVFRTSRFRFDLLVGALYDRMVMEVQSRDQTARQRFEGALPTLGVGVLFAPDKDLSAYVSFFAGHIGQTNTRGEVPATDDSSDSLIFSDDYEEVEERSFTVIALDLSVRYKVADQIGLTIGVRANYIEFDYYRKDTGRDQLRYLSVGPTIGLFTEF